MLNFVVVHSINMPSVSGMNSQSTATPHNHALMHPHNVTLTFEHVIQTPDKCKDKKPQLHRFGQLCCTPYKHLVESVKKCAAWGRRWRVSLHRGGLSSLPREKNDKNPHGIFLNLSPQLRHYCSSLFWIYDLWKKMKVPNSALEPKRLQFKWA